MNFDSQSSEVTQNAAEMVIFTDFKELVHFILVIISCIVLSATMMLYECKPAEEFLISGLTCIFTAGGVVFHFAATAITKATDQAIMASLAVTSKLR